MIKLVEVTANREADSSLRSAAVLPHLMQVQYVLLAILANTVHSASRNNLTLLQRIRWLLHVYFLSTAKNTKIMLVLSLKYSICNKPVKRSSKGGYSRPRVYLRHCMKQCQHQMLGKDGSQVGCRRLTAYDVTPFNHNYSPPPTSHPSLCHFPPTTRTAK